MLFDPKLFISWSIYSRKNGRRFYAKVWFATEHFESKTWILIDFFTRPLSSISFNKFLLKYFYFWSQCTKISFIHREKRYKVLLVNRLHYILEGHRFDKLWQNCETQVSQLHLIPENLEKGDICWKSHLINCTLLFIKIQYEIIIESNILP